MEKSEFVELYHRNVEEIKLDLNSYSRMGCLIAMIGGKPKKHDKKPVISPPKERIQSISKYELPPRSWYGLELFEKSKTEEVQIEANNKEETRKKRKRKISDLVISIKKNMEIDDNMIAEELPVPESSLPTEYMNANINEETGKKWLQKTSVTESTLPTEYMNALAQFAGGKTIEDLKLRSRKDDKRASMNSMIVDVIPPSLKPAEVDLREWTMSNGILVLTKSWYKLVVSNSIEAGETFEVWVGRIGVEEKLCFLLVRVTV